MHIFHADPMEDSFHTTWLQMKQALLKQPFFESGQWQSQDNPQAAKTRELRNVILTYQMPGDKGLLAGDLLPNLPWAEDHFQERVSGKPLNPPPSEAWWPYRIKGNAEHKREDGTFSHTYPERMWPPDLYGIRFRMGDLDDVVDLLIKQPNTRQAYLPIWFPEDTGAVHGERVPCTLGYHFLIRDGQLHVTYFMRSCDVARHLKDDIYMAVRLAQWVRDRISFLTKVTYWMGELTMHIVSLHSFPADDPIMKAEIKQHLVKRGQL